MQRGAPGPGVPAPHKAFGPGRKGMNAVTTKASKTTVIMATFLRVLIPGLLSPPPTYSGFAKVSFITRDATGGEITR